jgi:hypothetical protein
LRSTQAATVRNYEATTTFAATLPTNSFSGNTGSNNYGNCFITDTTGRTITGDCS